jgi:hypothetical protein
VIPDLPKITAYLLSPGQPTPGRPNLLRPHIALQKSAGILTCFPSTTHFCLALGADSPCADERCARKPWAFGGGAFHPPYRYSCQHSHFRYLQRTSQSTFAGVRNAPLPRTPKRCAPRASVHGLAPLNLPRRPTRPVSYYAFFKGWLLLSQPPGCLCLSTSFST